MYRGRVEQEDEIRVSSEVRHSWSHMAKQDNKGYHSTNLMVFNEAYAAFRRGVDLRIYAELTSSQDVYDCCWVPSSTKVIIM